MTTATKPRTKALNRTAHKWKPIFLVHVYRMIKLGMTEQACYEVLRIGHQTWHNWKKRKPEFQEALDLGYAAQREESTLADYCYNRLPEATRALWDRIKEWEKSPNGFARIQLMMLDHGKKVQQQLFLHALVSSHFSPSRAMSRVGITKRKLDVWMNEDPEFAEMVEEMNYHKKNFFEELLVQRARAGDTQAIVFANKTLNKDRGYGVSMSVQHSGSVTHAVGSFDLADLLPYMAEAVKMGVLEALNKYEASKQIVRPEELSPEERLSREISDLGGGYEQVPEPAGAGGTGLGGHDGSLLGGPGAAGQGLQAGGPPPRAAGGVEGS
jgi:hypothetical protein